MVDALRLSTLRYCAVDRDELDCPSQTAGFCLAFRHRGGVAQLGERLVRNQKAVSSILITSTTFLKAGFPGGGLNGNLDSRGNTVR